jgi:serine/threonine protein kinase
MLIVLTVIHGANRSADGVMRTTVCNSVTAGLAKVTTAGVAESAGGMGGLGGLGGGGGGGPGTDAVSLAGLGGKAGPGQAASIATGHNVRPSAAHGKDGNGVGGDGSNDWYAPPPHIQYRYPDGVLMVPAGLNESWVCIDARPLNKHAMIIALNTDRRVSIWNSSAAEATGFSAATRIDKLAKECFTAPGDTLFRLPRMVGDHAILELHNVVTANTSLPFVVGDVRDLAGEPAGHCFVAPAIRDDLTSMRSFLHEYLQHEMWEGLAYCDAVAKQLKDLVARTEGTVTLGLLDGDALKASSGRSRNSNQGTPSSALRPALDADNRRISSSSSQRSDPTHKRQSSGARGPSTSSGGEQMQLMGDSAEAFAADDWAMQLAADMQLLQTSIQREVAKMRLGVRLMGWDTLNTTARLCSTEWEWTNGERLLGAAARYHFAKASVGVETNVPPSFRLPASAARIIKAIINFAPAHCSVFLQHSQRSKRVGRVTVTVTLVSTDKNNGMGVMSGLGEKSHGLDSSARGNSMARSSVTLEHLRHSRAAVRERFDFDVLTAQVGREVFECCATVQMFSDDTAVSVHFPCVRDAVEDPANDPQKTPGGGLKPQSPGITSSGNTLLPTVATYCDCVVAVCLAQPMDQHNLGMMLLGITGVSLTICRDVADLQQRLPTVDMVVIANAYRARIEVDEDFDAVVIPVVDQDAPYQADASFLRLPLQRDDVFKLIVDASEVVAENKRAHEEAKEREAILQTRHDATWTKGALLGRGTFGVCYSATNDVTGGIMAVKQFEFVPRRAHGNVEDADAERERFMTSLVNEIRILTKLDHPNIVHYFHCERTDGGVNLFMELCEGSLHDVIRKHRTRDTSALYHKALPVILQQTLLAVAYLHNLSIIHRDLKPQNILTKGDRIKLTDFGTAHQVSQDETLHDTQGTLRFMAPEVYQAQSYNWSCDVWSIGCIVCEMLDVRVPFMNPGQHHMLGDIQQADTVVDQTLAGHVSDEARDFINLCLQVKPELRPSVSTLLLHPLVETQGSPFRLTTLMGGRPAPSSQPVVQQPSDVVGDAEAPNEDEMLPPAVVADFEGDGFSLDSQA